MEEKKAPETENKKRTGPTMDWRELDGPHHVANPGAWEGGWVKKEAELPSEETKK